MDIGYPFRILWATPTCPCTIGYISGALSDVLSGSKEVNLNGTLYVYFHILAHPVKLWYPKLRDMIDMWNLCDNILSEGYSLPTMSEGNWDVPNIDLKFCQNRRLARLSGAAFILHSGANLAFLRDVILDHEQVRLNLKKISQSDLKKSYNL